MTDGENPSPDEDFAALLADSQRAAHKEYAPGDRVRAQIISLGAEDAIVALGPGREGAVAASELAGLTAGESVDLFVTSVRPHETRLSIHPTDKNIAEDLKEAFETRRPVEGRVVEVCKGGVRVSVRGKNAFCPLSQLDAKRVETGAEFVGRAFAFRVTQWSEEGRSVVLSRRALLEEERERAAAAYFEAHPEGCVVAGTVTRLEKFGAFIELLPGVEGLAHVSELAWSRVGSPCDLLKVGQSVAVKLLKREIVDGRLKLSLSLKQATSRPEAPTPAPIVDPWTKYAPGQVLTGKLVRKQPYGAFIELEPGVVGLLHQSKFEDRADFDLPRRKLGETVAVEIVEVRLDERRISLALPRDPDADQWRQAQESEPPPPGALAQSLRRALDKRR